MKILTTKDGSKTVFSERYQQTYHSDHGAVTEARMIYLQNSGLLQRLEQDLNSKVLEIGFGLGLNFLLTADATLNRRGGTIEYTAFESQLADIDIFEQTYYQLLLKHPQIAQRLHTFLRQLLEKPPHLLKISKNIKLELHLLDASQYKFCESQFDIIYLDAFSPDTNPELWTHPFLSELYTTLLPGGILCTYCVKGEVRRTMQSIGFNVSKLPGPPGKREVLVAKKPMAHRPQY